MVAAKECLFHACFGLMMLALMIGGCKNGRVKAIKQKERRITIKSWSPSN